jgi:hypothetical protein
MTYPGREKEAAGRADAIAILRSVGLDGWASSGEHVTGVALVIARVRELLRQEARSDDD